MEGFVGITPKIKKVDFEQRGKMKVTLLDGREITLPLKNFPSLAKVPATKRNKVTIANGSMLVFHHCDEVYHLQDFLGLPENYAYKG